MSDDDGDFGPEEHVDRPCPKCNGKNVFLRVWSSHCGGYEDERYDCRDCGHHWWVDGPDA